jgi:hypothetical protein
MSYTPPYPGGWKDFPDTSTPIDAASLDTMDAGIAAAQGTADQALADANTIATTGYRFVETVYFTSSGNFVKASYPYLRAIRVKCQGAGGGGGGAVTTGASQSAYGTGGGGGGYAESFITDIAGLSSSVTVTVGAGGAGGAAGGNNGSAGSNSSFGSTVIGNGGPGGNGITNVQTATAGAMQQFGVAGGGGTGNLVINGGASPDARDSGLPTLAHRSPGGGSFLAPVNLQSLSGAAGVDGLAGRIYGGGGSAGGNSASQGTARAGGVGGAGIVIVELYA